MTKALVTIEVDFDTYNVANQSGLGESSNPEHPPARRIEQAKREWVWDETHNWLKDKKEFIQIVKVSLTRNKMCEFCDANPPRTPDSKWCESCRDDYKEGVSRF